MPNPDSIASYDRQYNNSVNVNYRNSQNSNVYPDLIAYYDTSGNFDTCVGNPFLRKAFDQDNHLLVGVVNPPNVTTKVVYTDELNGKVLDVRFYNLIYCSDTGCWVALFEHKETKGHEYTLFYSFRDSSGKRLFDIKTQLR